MTAEQPISTVEALVTQQQFLDDVKTALIETAIQVQQNGQDGTELTAARVAFAGQVIANTGQYVQSAAYVVASLAAASDQATILATVAADWNIIGQIAVAPVTRAQLATDPTFQTRVLLATTDAATAYLATPVPTVEGGATQDQVDADLVERAFCSRIQAGQDLTPQERLQFTMNVLADPVIDGLSDFSAVTDAQIAQAITDGAALYVGLQLFLKANNLPAT